MNLQPYLVALALAFMAESMTEYLFANWIGWAKEKWPVVERLNPLKYIAAGVGVAFAFVYSLDLIAAMLGAVPNPAWVGIVLTGLAVGRGANYVHDFAKTYLGLNS